MVKKTRTIEVKPYYECTYCDFNSLDKRVDCPCALTTCKAEQVGTVTTTIKVKIYK